MATAKQAPSEASTGSQTLSRGIRILEALAGRDDAMTIPDLVSALDLHRSIVYRLLRTLEDHRLVVRDEHGRVSLGPRLAALATGIDRDLQQAALPALRAAADDLRATCFLVSHDRGEVVTLVSAPPHRHIVAVAQNPGTVHPLGLGAPGRAILGQLPVDRWPDDLPEERRTATHAAIAAGFAVSQDEVITGLHSVAVPLQIPGHDPLAIAVVRLAIDEPVEQIAQRLLRAADGIRTDLGADAPAPLR